eukprot:COSAG02_NODE_3641_length_6437_cov_237.157936_5_plen_94_part_00
MKCMLTYQRAGSLLIRHANYEDSNLLTSEHTPSLENRISNQSEIRDHVSHCNTEWSQAICTKVPLLRRRPRMVPLLKKILRKPAYKIVSRLTQ